MWEGGKSRRRVEIGLQRWYGQMSRHHAANTCRNRCAKGNQFQAIEAFAIGVNHRQVDVRVAGRIAMPWKMFRGGQTTVFFHAANKGRYVFGTRAGSSPNDRVLMIGLPGLLFTSASGA